MPNNIRCQGRIMKNITILEETASWRSRNVKYYAGSPEVILRQIPSFELRPFFLNGEDVVNPFYKTVVRLPLTKIEKEIPVGIVSSNYSLAPHKEVAELCLKAIQNSSSSIDKLDCELGLSELGEWMNLRIYFPDNYDFIPPDGHKLRLRLECFNSVDGSSRLVILFGWYRLVCSNGMVIGETVTELRDIHNKYMQSAIDICKEGIKNGQTPFGAVIVKDGKIISKTHNQVWQTTDITAHAEIKAIQEACKNINSVNLSGAIIYSTCEPCPMCFSAIHWANIDTIVYGAEIEDAKEVGFNELSISNIQMKELGNSNVKIIKNILQNRCKELFVVWNKQENKRRY